MKKMTDRIAGRSKEFLGKITGDKKLEMKGKAQAELGELKDKAKETLSKIDSYLENIRD